MALMASPPSRNSDRYKSRMAAALRRASPSMRRPKQRGSSRLENTAAAENKSTASVVVFMPPAVEPGDPPMSMSITSTIWPTSLSAVRSMVLKPAVRGVMDWNSALSTRSPTGSASESSKA